MKSRGDRLEHRAVVDERGHREARGHGPPLTSQSKVGPYRNLQRAAKPAREEEKKETEAPVEQNSSSKRPTGLWNVVNRRRKVISAMDLSHSNGIVALY